MPTPALRDPITHGIHVGVTARYVPEESSPDERRYLFVYHIVIVNEGPAAATLRARHWVIIDGDGTVEEVKGEGVVGQQPRLAPGEIFKYTSYCPLTTEWGTMEGAYDFQTDAGEHFEVKIGRFYLAQARRQ